MTSYESTVGYTYDAGNRMTQAVDSAGGTITEAYDNLDRLTSETTPQGSITYGYDLAGRRASMTVAGQPQVTYSYDNANRLTQIAQGASTVGFSYDTVNRRSTLTLSNGVNMAYTYDNDSRVTGITYKFNANTLGTLTYTYDSLGRRTQVGGSFAQTGLSGTITSATYDAANELTNWNGTPISYDLNGNMLSDGTNAFTWNARNQVATLNNVSLQYDGFGRRTKNVHNTSFLFDGANAVQELSGSTPTANLISGGIDEIITRADSTGAFTPLQDALGSTIALVDASGNLVTQYAYDPFGNTTVSGAGNSNAFQYTGRENEGNGLYFYRARYYSPVLHRFINQDPLGLGGSGPNLYAYTGNSPTNFSDPFGLQTVTTGPTTTPYAGNPTPAQVDEALQSVKNATQAAEAAQAAPSLLESLEGPSVFALATADAQLLVTEIQTVASINVENDAYAEEMHAIGVMNQALMAHSKPNGAPPLAGRSCKKGSGDNDGCDERHGKEEAFCREEYGSYPKLLSGCLDRAFWRWSNCKKGIQDPGPLDPMDPNWRWD